MLTDTPSFRRGGRGFAEPEVGEARATGGSAEIGGREADLADVPRHGRRILIVQGDWEAGMSLLALDLKDEGHHVGKVFFCAPDVIYQFRGIQTHMFRAPIEDFEAWLRELVKTEGYDTFFLYNHYRPYNQIAWNLAAEFQLGCYVFELGLIRPNCVMVFSREQLPISAIPRAWKALLAGGAATEAGGNADRTLPSQHTRETGVVLREFPLQPHHIAACSRILWISGT